MIKKISVYSLKFMTVLLLFTSCSDEFDQKKESISNAIEEFRPNLGKCYKSIVILPGSGCPGCITTAEDFFQYEVKNDNYFFILTNIQSVKMLNQKTGLKVESLSNVYLDYDNKFSAYEQAIYPVVILNNCANNEIDKIYFQKPGTDAFAKIQG